MQESRFDGLLIQLQIRQNDRHAERMNDVGLSGFAHLPLMGFRGDQIGLFDHGDIV